MQHDDDIHDDDYVVHNYYDDNAAGNDEHVVNVHGSLDEYDYDTIVISGTEHVHAIVFHRSLDDNDGATAYECPFHFDCAGNCGVLDYDDDRGGRPASAPSRSAGSDGASGHRLG